MLAFVLSHSSGSGVACPLPRLTPLDPCWSQGPMLIRVHVRHLPRRERHSEEAASSQARTSSHLSSKLHVAEAAQHAQPPRTTDCFKPLICKINARASRATSKSTVPTQHIRLPPQGGGRTGCSKRAGLRFPRRPQRSSQRCTSQVGWLCSTPKQSARSSRLAVSGASLGSGRVPAVRLRAALRSTPAHIPFLCVILGRIMLRLSFESGGERVM